MATIKDIAKLTGVSCTTVSNVIHNRPGRVSEDTVEKIHKAILELDYVPNMSARTLVSSSSKVVALINHAVTVKNYNFMNDPFQASLFGVIESALREYGYFLMVRTIETADELLTFVRNWNVDGVFITGVFQDSFFEALSSLAKPVVLIDSYIRHPDFCNVGLQDFEGGLLATRYMAAHGHRRIAFASPHKQNGGVLQERFRGYKTALAENGISFDPTLVFEYGMDLKSCCELSGELSQHPDITGVITTADIMAAGIITGLRTRNIRVPADISVIGFDDMNIAQLVLPPLTTIHQDVAQKGIAAVNLMVKKLEQTNTAFAEIALPVSLVERESVAQL